ncbi:hypothetical protein ZWY2020_044281 [Hordeum vulgare]|nr:hypothetical protein ZWY2020_044281 [Hordeum vulgare]
MHNGFARETLRIPVHVGTMVRRKKGSVLVDLAHPGDEVLVARGGQGGPRGRMFGMRASGAAASWVVGRMSTDAHLYDDPEDAAIPALLDSRFDTHL